MMILGTRLHFADRISQKRVLEIHVKHVFGAEPFVPERRAIFQGLCSICGRQ